MTDEKDPAFEQGIQAVREYWETRAKSAPSDNERVDSSPRTQRMRFEAFVTSNDLRGKSVLDVGCGMGDLFVHLKQRGLDVDYLGVDISPEMIQRAAARHPDAKFEAGDLLAWGNERRFDYVVAIGIHNYTLADSGHKLLEKLTKKQFELCKIATHLSLLTSRYKGFEGSRQAWVPQEILTFGFTLTPYVSLRHDYLPHDFGITLYREPIIDTRKDLVLG